MRTRAVACITETSVSRDIFLKSKQWGRCVVHLHVKLSPVRQLSGTGRTSVHFTSSSYGLGELFIPRFYNVAP